MQPGDHQQESLPKRTVQRFGERAIQMKLITPQQLQNALDEQRRLKEKGVEKLLGMIMLSMGILDNTGLLSVLKTYETDSSTANG